MLLFLFLHLVVRQIDWIFFHLKFILNLTLMLVFALSFTLRLTTEPFRKRLDEPAMYSLFGGNNRQYVPICTKMIYSWVRKVLGIEKAHMSPSTLQAAAVSVALVADVYRVSIMQAGDWAKVSVPSRHYFSTYITTIDCHQDSIQHAVLGLSE